MWGDLVLLSLLHQHWLDRYKDLKMEVKRATPDEQAVPLPMGGCTIAARQAGAIARKIQLPRRK